MINLYIDMDGVVADFDDFIKDYYPELPHQERFRKAVIEEKVFENLSDMEGGNLLIYTVRKLKTKFSDDEMQINFLTSVGTKDPELGAIVSEQKQKWLTSRGYTYKPLFVTEKKYKATYAHINAILIDDREGCVEPFREAGGRAILHKYPHDTIYALEEHLDLIAVMG
jgi:hypothetical protein